MVDSVSSAAAANAYSTTAKSGAEMPKGLESREDGPKFSDFLRQSVTDSIDTMRAGEKASADAVTGKASLPDVVGAITQAELTLQTVVAVRDRLISAYQEIMRMPM